MHHGLWPPGTPLAQRWLIGIFLTVMLAALPPLFSRSFVPTAQWQRGALLLALLCTAAACALLRHWYRQGRWAPAGPWRDYSPRKRWMMAPLCLGFVVCMLWLDLALSLPQLYTRLAGADTTRSTWVQKKRSSGRRSCHHQLQLADTRFWLFEFCINAEAFDQLPEGPQPATLYSRRTLWGEYIHSVALPGAAPQDDPASPAPGP